VTHLSGELKVSELLDQSFRRDWKVRARVTEERFHNPASNPFRNGSPHRLANPGGPHAIDPAVTTNRCLVVRMRQTK
jgi:hypothetical protein